MNYKKKKLQEKETLWFLTKSAEHEILSFIPARLFLIQLS